MLRLNNILIALLVSSTVFFYGCPSNEPTEEGEGQESAQEEQVEEQEESADEGAAGLQLELMEEKDGIKLYKKTSSYEYIEATLKMKNPINENTVTSPVDFVFDLAYYNLGVQTPDAEGLGLANSGKGQHIHLILNNGPYSAHYEPVFKKELEPGNYVALAFLSRSYHESVKGSNAYVLKQFTVGNATPSYVDLERPCLFYSRPKGTYTGDDTKQVLLDFFLTEFDLMEGGNFVRATINGETQFDLYDWKPYVLEGLPMGETTIKLELMEGNGLLIDSPFNVVERTITLEEASAE